MTVKMIVPFGESILRKKAKPVEQMNARIFKLLDDMVDTLYAAEGRAGLAAPQVGVLRRVIVMDCGDGLIELINPEIIETRGEQVGMESCLSFPGYVGSVKRAQYVKIKTLNRRGKIVELEGTDYLARCIQHEIDHLNGVLFIDHIQGNALFHEKNQKKANLQNALSLSNQTY